NLRVEAGAQLAPDQRLHVLVAGILGQLQRRRRLLADGVGVLAGDAEQVAFHEHRIAATQALGDVADAARGQGHGLALRHHDGGAVALETDGFAAAGIHAGDMGLPAALASRRPVWAGEVRILADAASAYPWRSL